MFMFRKKDKISLTSDGLKEEANGFQKAIEYINENYKPSELDIDVLDSVSKKFNIDINSLREALKAYLKKNALKSIEETKKSSDYTVLDLEKAAEKYGFDLDSFSIDYFD